MLEHELKLTWNEEAKESAKQYGYNRVGVCTCGKTWKGAKAAVDGRALKHINYERWRIGL